MHARTVVVVEPGGRLAVVRCTPPLTVRQVRAADPDTCALCLVGTAAGPLPGDDLALRLDVAPGARATLRAAGAQLAQGAPGGPRPPARVRYDVVVGAGGALDAEPGALVVAGNADVEVDVHVDLAADATLRWRETVVLGRHGEAPGRVVLRWDVRRAGVPLLRQDVDLGDPALRRWPGMHAGAASMTTVLHVDPARDDPTEVRSPLDVTQRLVQGATLTTTLGVVAAQGAVPAHAVAAPVSSRVTTYDAVSGEATPKRALTA